MTNLSTVVQPGPSPFVTYYDVGTGERTELSRATVANWAAKTAGFLALDLDAELRTRVRLALPSHWLRFCWLAACWQVGATVTDSGPADIGVTGPDLNADEPLRVASALLPLGARFPQPPEGFLDVAVEVPAHSDVFVALHEPSDDTTAVDLEGTRLDHAAFWQSCPADDRRRLLTPGSLLRDARAMVSAARGSGSLVVVSGGDEAELARIAGQEHATT